MRRILGLAPSPRPHWVGDGFPVRSMFSHHVDAEQVSPFLLLDYAAPHAFAPADRPRGVGQHPHRGFETVTIVYQGELEHRDSTGSGGRIGPGDVQWMTAASGILHEEFHSQEFTRSGGTLEMAQLWVNLPAKDKGAPPGYQTLLDRDIPSLDLPAGAGRLRVIAGTYGGARGPARTFTPIDIWDVRLHAGCSATFSVADGRTAIAAVLAGTVLVNDAEIAREAHTVFFTRDGGDIRLEANADAKILMLSGKPIDEPVVSHGPFVMNTAEEIQQAVLDFQSGRFGSMKS